MFHPTIKKLHLKLKKLDVGVVDAIIDRFNIELPNTMRSVAPLLHEILEPDCDDSCHYQLLYGKVQSGKSLAISLIMWILKYKYSFLPVFLTKNLCSIRCDITSKLTCGKIIDIIHSVCNKYSVGTSLYVPNV